MPIPASRASKGLANLTFFPSIEMVPSYPPVSWITVMPKRIFIKVDFPAPFSPTNPSIFPFSRLKDTFFKTLLWLKDLLIPLTFKRGSKAMHFTSLAGSAFS